MPRQRTCGHTGREHASVGERGMAWGWTPASSRLADSGCEALRKKCAPARARGQGSGREAHQRRNIFFKSLVEFALSTRKRKGSYRVKSLLGAYEADTERPEPARSYQAVSGSCRLYQVYIDISLIYEPDTGPVRCTCPSARPSQAAPMSSTPPPPPLAAKACTSDEAAQDHMSAISTNSLTRAAAIRPMM